MKKYNAPEVTIVTNIQANVICTSFTIDPTTPAPSIHGRGRNDFSSEDEWDDEDF